METPLVSPYEGVVRKVHVAEGDQVAGGAVSWSSRNEVRVLEDAGAFLDQAGPLLLADEARHNLILGISRHAARVARPIHREALLGRFDDGEPVAAALRTPPYNLILARPRDDAALVRAGRSDRGRAARRRRRAPGGGHVRAAVGRRARRRDADASRQGVYALERVQPVPPAPGSSRPASQADEELLLDWMVAFGEEVLDDNDPGRTEARAAGRAPALRPRRRLHCSGRTRDASSRSPAGAGRLRTASVSARSTRRPSYAGAATRPRSSPSSRRRSSTADVASSSSTPTSRTRRRTRSTSASGTSGSPSRR